ncbi:MAG: hypothetical protein QXE16_02585, partial [Candidatus Bathyarchaeia archaeon]
MDLKRWCRLQHLTFAFDKIISITEKYIFSDIYIEPKNGGSVLLGGFMGKILKVDMSTGTLRRENL